MLNDRELKEVAREACIPAWEEDCDCLICVNRLNAYRAIAKAAEDSLLIEIEDWLESAGFHWTAKRLNKYISNLRDDYE